MKTIVYTQWIEGLVKQAKSIETPSTYAEATLQGIALAGENFIEEEEEEELFGTPDYFNSKEFDKDCEKADDYWDSLKDQ